MIVIVFELHAAAARTQELIEFVGSLLPETRSYPGCIQIEMFNDQADPAQVVCIEKWESREAYDAYIAWRTETGIISGALALCDGPPVLRVLSATNI